MSRNLLFIVAVMMRSNFDRLADIADIAHAYDAPLRVNVYQSVRSDRFALTYDEYWRGFETLFARTDVVAIGEPLVRALAGMPPRRGGCGLATVRITPLAGPGSMPSANPPTADATDTYRLPTPQYIFDIARQKLGDGMLWPEILRLNPALQTDQPIPAGTELRLPKAR